MVDTTGRGCFRPRGSACVTAPSGPLPSAFSSILKCGVRCVKEAILSCKCVFFCVWRRGEWWGGGGGGGGLGGSTAPDADPLRKNKGGEGGRKTFKTAAETPETRPMVAPNSADEPPAAAEIHAPNSDLCFSESAFIRLPMCRRAASIFWISPQLCSRNRDRHISDSGSASSGSGFISEPRS